MNDGHKWVKVTSSLDELQFGDEVYGYVASIVRYAGEVAHHSPQKVVIRKDGGGDLNIFPMNLAGRAIRRPRGATPPLEIDIYYCDSPGHGRHRFSHTQVVTIEVPKD